MKKVFVVSALISFIVLSITGKSQVNTNSDILPKFYFKAVINKQEMYFQEVSGLNIETQNKNNRSGSSPVYSVVKMPGLKKYSNITLKKGYFKNNPKNSDWYNQIMNIKNRANMDLYLLDEAGKPSLHWTIINAAAIKLVCIDKNAATAQIESMEIASEGITIQ